MVSIHFALLLKGISNTWGKAVLMASAPLLPKTVRQPAKIATSVGEPWKLPGDAGSGFAAVLRTPHLARARMSTSLPQEKASATGAVRTPLLSSTGTAKSVAVILPEVRVPVLSLHRMPTQPRVSTASILRTKTLRFAIFLEAIIRQTVTVGSSPSGTCAKKAVAAFVRTSERFLLCGDKMLATKDKQPTATATYAMMWTKCSIWISKEDRVRDVRILAAIWPSNVLSPVPNTSPSIRPWITVVPLKVTLRASTSAWHLGAISAVLGSATDSPVSAELSTSVPSEQATTRRSAGTFCPASSSTMSPGTRSSANTCNSTLTPSLMRWQVTVAADAICCRAFIMPSACISIYHCSVADAIITPESTTGVTLSSPPRTKAKKSSQATQIHNMILKSPPKICFRSNTHWLSRSGGVSLFSPNSRRRWAMAHSSRPKRVLVAARIETPCKAVPKAFSSSLTEGVCGFWRRAWWRDSCSASTKAATS
mmetsp:Transcript_118031/g.376333  ORF Transcript_118031/g.376333 Transcript_118031/m.376333 type:complete len:481 (+) Transcript_118031:1645-3087(+)